MRNISVVIPAHNEEGTIEQVIDIVNKCNLINEIIVVDNVCTDQTAQKAKQKGAKVVECLEKGKGYAMEKGVQSANGEIIVFLDGDINNYSDNIVQKLVDPIINDRADFVKSMFEREGGRVTELVAKPLLDILFPNMYKFAQPLSGMIAGRREVFDKIQFEKDYGVDIGILLDVIQMGTKIEEVHIGKIKNLSHQWKGLEKMSHEVIKAIINRAKIEQ